MKVEFQKNHTWGEGNIAYFILVDGDRVGTMSVDRFGWKQFQRVRGRDASQQWTVRIDGKPNAFFDYFEEAKQYAKRELTEVAA